MSKSIASSLVHRFVISNPRFRSVITKALIPDKDLDVTIVGATLRINRRQEMGYYRAAKAGNGNIVFRDEMASVLNLALMLERGDTFVDVGANVGLYSALLGRFAKVWPENRWYAFEANQKTHARLEKTTRDLPIRVYNLALSNKTGALEFTGGAVSGVFGATGSRGRFQYGPSVKIPCRTLDSMGIEGERVVLKIDVEGHEREVIDGAEGLFRAGRVKAVYLDGYADKTLPAWLEGRGFRILDGRSLTAELPKHSLLAIAA